MTKAEALTEAQRRWGSVGAVDSWRIHGPYGPMERYVGTKGGWNSAWVVRGSGRTWEAAFEAADKSDSAALPEPTESKGGAA